MLAYTQTQTQTQTRTQTQAHTSHRECAQSPRVRKEMPPRETRVALRITRESICGSHDQLHVRTKRGFVCYWGAAVRQTGQHTAIALRHGRPRLRWCTELYRWYARVYCMHRHSGTPAAMSRSDELPHVTHELALHSSCFCTTRAMGHAMVVLGPQNKLS